MVFQYILNYINTEETDDDSNAKPRTSLKRLEIHLIVLLLINILFNPAFTGGNVLPMKIFQNLLLVLLFQVSLHSQLLVLLRGFLLF